MSKIFNGLEFANEIKSDCPNAELSTEAQTIIYDGAYMNAKTFLERLTFKENTSYIITLDGSNSEDRQTTGLRVVYSDGTSQLLNLFQDGKSITTTAKNKTISYLGSVIIKGKVTLNYNKCSINEYADGLDVSKFATKDDLKNYASKASEHTHSNKSTLDTITSEKIAKWDAEPTIPTKVSELTNDSKFRTQVDVQNDIKAFISFTPEGNLKITIDGVSKEFTPKA